MLEAFIEVAALLGLLAWLAYVLKNGFGESKTAKVATEEVTRFNAAANAWFFSEFLKSYRLHAEIEPRWEVIRRSSNLEISSPQRFLICKRTGFLDIPWVSKFRVVTRESSAKLLSQ